VQSMFKDNVIQPVQFRESAQWRSHIGQLAIDGMQVELMAGVERRVGKQWLPSMITTNSTVLVDGIAVRVVTLEEQTLAYLRQSRLDRVGMALPLCRPDILGQLLHELAREGYF